MTPSAVAGIQRSPRGACRKVCQQTKKRADCRGFQAGFPSEGPTPSAPFTAIFKLCDRPCVSAQCERMASRGVA